MKNIQQNWFTNPPKFWLFVCALSGGMFASMLINYGGLAFIVCSIFAVAINTYNFPKLIIEKGVFSGIVFLAQSSILIGLIGCGVISRVNNIALTFSSVGEFCAVVLVCQVVSFFLMKAWMEIKKHKNVL